VDLVRHKLQATTYGRGGKRFSLREEFKYLDKDHSGSVSLAEFMYVVRRKCPIAPENIALVFAEVDADADGEVQLDELVAFLRSVRPPARPSQPSFLPPLEAVLRSI